VLVGAAVLALALAGCKQRPPDDPQAATEHDVLSVDGTAETALKVEPCPAELEVVAPAEFKRPPEEDRAANNDCSPSAYRPESTYECLYPDSKRAYPMLMIATERTDVWRKPQGEVDPATWRQWRDFALGRIVQDERNGRFKPSADGGRYREQMLARWMRENDEDVPAEQDAAKAAYPALFAYGPDSAPAGHDAATRRGGERIIDFSRLYHVKGCVVRVRYELASDMAELHRLLSHTTVR
jgi:hypothetical protein